MTDKVRTKVIKLDGVRLKVPMHWDDVTRELSPTGRPFTLASSKDEVGALQVSLANYLSGEIPNPTAKDLMSMLLEFSTRRRLGKPIDTNVTVGDKRYARASFRSEGDFVRVWYLSDGQNLAMVTYICPWKDRKIQLEECQQIVESLEFI